MEINKVFFDENFSDKIDKTFEDLDVNDDGKITSADISATDDIDIKNEITEFLDSDVDNEAIMDLNNYFSSADIKKTCTINSLLLKKSVNEGIELSNVEQEKKEEKTSELYYINGVLANGVCTINGERINFKNGKPAKGVYTTSEILKDESGNTVYQQVNTDNGLFRNEVVMKTIRTIYGEDGKLFNGEQDGKLYKDGQLYTGPSDDGKYYVDGVINSTFTGVGTDGLMYEDGQLFTGEKYNGNIVYYNNGAKLNGCVNDLYYKNGVLLTGVYTIDGEKINLKNGKPAKGVYTTSEILKDESGNTVYQQVNTDNGLFRNEVVMKTIRTIYGEDGKLFNGEQDGKLYKDGQLYTGPSDDGKYYVDGVINSTFTGVGTDGLMYEDGQLFTGEKYNGNIVYYNNGAKLNGYN